MTTATVREEMHSSLAPLQSVKGAGC